MPEGDRLGALQVGEAGHDRVEMFQGLARQRLLIVAQRGIKSVDAIADVEAEVGCDLVVARTRGVQPPGRRPDQIGKARLHVHVYILQRGGEFEGAVLDL